MPDEKKTTSQQMEQAERLEGKSMKAKRGPWMDMDIRRTNALLTAQVKSADMV
jgi:hypothetical protein